nr:PREDICTED: sterol 26-hydroxylase, mitochondrial [Lepisosteus oculatus]
MAVALTRRSVEKGFQRLHEPLAVTSSLALRRNGGSSATLAAQADRGELKSGKDLPGTTTWKTLYRMLFKGYRNRLHELQIYEKKLYGPLYRAAVGNYNTVNLNTVELLEELLRKDEKYPCRGDMSLWTDYRDMRGVGYGPFTEEGEKWYHLRAILNKRMLYPKDSVKYEPVINEVVSDFIKTLFHLRQASPTGDMVQNLSNELYRFSLEGISSILFETRIGCLEREIPPETQHFIDSIAKMFFYSSIVSVLPKWTQNYLPFWKKYISGWDGIFDFAEKLIDKKIEDIQSRLNQGETVEGEYLTYLLSSTKLTNRDVYGSITELLLAGVDTTSNTMMWALYRLSHEQEAQDTLYREVAGVVPEGSIPTAQDITHMPYLRAVIKETLRMYPVVPFNARVMLEQDVVVGGHYFPKNTTFVMCHYAIGQDESVFPEPWKFKPERWLRDGRARPNPFGSIPFGFGVRGCAGRRIAELEMHLALARIIRLFEIRPDTRMGEVKAFHRTVLVADRQVNLHFIERKGSSAQ